MVALYRCGVHCFTDVAAFARSTRTVSATTTLLIYPPNLRRLNVRAACIIHKLWGANFASYETPCARQRRRRRRVRRRRRCGRLRSAASSCDCIALLRTADGSSNSFALKALMSRRLIDATQTTGNSSDQVNPPARLPDVANNSLSSS